MEPPQRFYAAGGDEYMIEERTDVSPLGRSFLLYITWYSGVWVLQNWTHKVHILAQLS